MIFNFDNTYAELSSKLYTEIIPEKIQNPQLLILNKKLLEELNIKMSDDITEYLCANKLTANPIAMAYAGHQFGHFTMLGDGRAILLGEQITGKNERFDIQLKGSGITPYSRGGDGKAAAGSMLREYLYSADLDGLNIKTSKSLAVILTNEKVQRERIEEGALLVRVMQSHIRIGTFEFISSYHEEEDLALFADYVINRHYKYIFEKSGNRYINFFEAVMDNLIDMVVEWLRVGFIHGVMNTDNMSITGETFDYGPCAFMNSYDLKTTFSSIDRDERYSFGNQRSILKWNLARFAEALLPVISKDQYRSDDKLNEIFMLFDDKFNVKFYAMMRNKLGISSELESNELIDDFLKWLEISKADYTNTFIALMDEDAVPDKIYKTADFLELKNRLSAAGLNKELMNQSNPYFILRNYKAEEAIEDYRENKSLGKINTLLDILKNPYENNLQYKYYQHPPEPDYDERYKTFCNT